MKKITRLLLVGVFIIRASFSVMAAEADATVVINGAPELRASMMMLTSLSFDFDQTVYDEHHMILSNSQGKCSIARPKRFRWELTVPYEQLIVSDGVVVYQYDADLSQVFKSRLETYHTSPALVLSGDMDAVEALFGIEKLKCEENTSCYKLLPKKDDPLVQYIVLKFGADKTPSQMMLVDGLNHETKIVMKNMQTNLKLDNSLFKFTPPDGVDVIEEANH